jgi:hypothetical protein
MATLTSVPFYCFLEDSFEKVHNLGSDTLKMALSNTEPTQATDDELVDITEISSGSGYTAGGETVTVSTSSQSGGDYSLVTSGTVSWTSSGTIGPFRYVVLYNDTAANDELICYYDISSAITLNNGDSYTIDVGTTLLSVAWAA